MALTHSPIITTSGLVLCLDAGNPRSFVPTSQFIWRDAMTSGFSFTLSGVNYYNSPNLGSITFEPEINLQGRGNAGNNTSLDTQTPTVEVWVNPIITNQNGFWFEKGAVNTQYSLFLEGTNIQWRQNISGVGISTLSTTTATYMNPGSWYQVVGTYTSGSRILYINGVQVNSDTQSGTLSTNASGMSIACYGGNSGSYGYYYFGSISIVRVYNVVLTAAQVLQNFNANRGRYGI